MNLYPHQIHSLEVLERAHRGTGSRVLVQQPCGTGKPESVFISWLLWQPRGADLAVEALKEVNKLARCQSADPDIIRLRALFTSLAGADGPMH